MKVRSAEMKDIDFLSEYDKYVRKEELRTGIALERILVAEEEEKPVGWLRWNLFWDNTPFMNMLYLLEGYRNRGYVDSGALLFPEEPLEIIFTKQLSGSQADEAHGQQ